MSFPTHRELQDRLRRAMQRSLAQDEAARRPELTGRFERTLPVAQTTPGGLLRFRAAVNEPDGTDRTFD